MLACENTLRDNTRKSGHRSFPFEDGKIVEVWEISDTLGLMMQLGMELKLKEKE